MSKCLPQNPGATAVSTTLDAYPSPLQYLQHVEQSLIDCAIDFSRFDVVATIHELLKKCHLEAISIECNKICIKSVPSAIAIEAFIMAMECASKSITIHVSCPQISVDQKLEIIAAIRTHMREFDVVIHGGNG